MFLRKWSRKLRNKISFFPLNYFFFLLDDLDLHEQTVKRNIECGTILIWFWLDSCQLCLCFFLLNCNPPSEENKKIVQWNWKQQSRLVSLPHEPLLMVKGISPKCVIMRDIFIAFEHFFMTSLSDFFGY